MLVEDRTYANAYLVPSSQQRQAAHDRLIAAGAKGLHFLKGEFLLGDDHGATVDSSHLTDLRMLRMADNMERVLHPILPQA